jgi:competence protein ComEA
MVKTLWASAFCVVFGLLAAGIILLIGREPRGIPISLLPAPTPAPIFVHVTGAVINPDIYPLPPKSRVRDAIEAAGGYSQAANPQSLNLAALLEDGQQIIVPASQPEPQGPGPSSTPGVESHPANPSGRININTASQAELESLPYIGEELSQKIIAYRETNGDFTTIESIQDVNGIRPEIFEYIKDLITVEE